MRRLLIPTLVVLLVALWSIFVSAQGTILDIASSTDEFSTLTAAVEAADPAIAEALGGEGPLTVFAPTNAAFAKSGIDIDALLGDQDLLTQFLLYHVVSGSVFSAQAAELDGQTVPTLLEGTALGITVNDAGEIVINGVATVVAPFDVDASNGVVHAIEDVIFPGVLQDRLFNLTGTAADEEMTEEAAGFGNIRVAHFSPDTRSVDIYVDGEVAVERMRFGDVTDFIELAAGTYEVAVTPAGLPLTAEQPVEGGEEGETETISNTIIGPAQLSIEADSWATIAAIGFNDNIDVAVIVEDYSALGEDETRATILHAIPDAPAVDIVAGGEALISGLSFPNSQIATLPAGTYDLAVTTTVAGNDITLLDLPGTNLEAGIFYLVAAIGTSADPEVAVATAAPMMDMSMEDMGDEGEEEATDEEAAGDEGEETEGEETEEAGDEEAAGDEGEEMAAEPTIAEIVVNATTSENPQFTTLFELIGAADPAVLDTLSGEGEFTVFAPTDEAFAALFDSIGLTAQDAISLGGAELLTPVLLHHVLGQVAPAEVVVTLDGQSVETLQGEMVMVSIVDGGVVLNDSINVIETDIMASNGIIHVIDGVLLPQVTIDTLASLGVEIGGE